MSSFIVKLLTQFTKLLTLFSRSRNEALVQFLIRAVACALFSPTF
jgi:hypothetical protein